MAERVSETMSSDGAIIIRRGDVDTIEIDTFVRDDLLRLLALPYATHPDYREEWRP